MIDHVQALEDGLSVAITLRDNAKDVRSFKDASVEIRQLMSALRDARAAQAAADADRDLSASNDPGLIAEALLREIPAICRVHPDLGREIRDAIDQALPPRLPETPK